MTKKEQSLLNELNIKNKTADDNPRHVGVGTTLKDRFILEELIATGGMGSIYKARDRRKEELHDRDPYVAIKVLGDEFRYHPQALIALQHEARKIQQLSHPHIINVYDFDRDGDIAFMTMEYLHGTTLDKMIKSTTLALNETRILNMAKAIADALEHAHQRGVIHSDLKPSNIFVTNENEIILIDFGIARSQKREETLIGDITIFDPMSLAAFTPSYASYEMLEGFAADPRDDIYAFACILYELFTKKHPYERLSAKEALKKGVKAEKPVTMSKTIWKVLQKGLAIKAEDRPRSAKLFIEEMTQPRPFWKFF